MANRLRFFVRLDSNNKPVLGSLIARPKKPKTNTWLEIFSPNCCNETLEYEPEGVVGDDLVFTLLCGETTLVSVTLTDTYLTVGDVVDALNAAFPFLGTFSELDGVIKLEVNSALLGSMCPYAAVTMSAEVDPI
jgi:hypothetical protein